MTSPLSSAGNALLDVVEVSMPGKYHLLISCVAERKLSLMDREVNRITFILNFIQWDKPDVLPLALGSIPRPPP